MIIKLAVIIITHKRCRTNAVHGAMINVPAIILR